MNAVDTLNAARFAGVELTLDGDDLVLEGASTPPPAVLDALSRHKPEIVALLRPGRDGWPPERWRVLFDERADAAEFDGTSRTAAEKQAFACCVAEWLNRNPVCSETGRCLGCGDRGLGHDPLLPYGVEPTGHAWLHSRCWPAWHAARKADAIAALTTMGLDRPRAHR